MKIIGITQRIDLIPEREEARDTVDQRLVSFIQSTGNTPVQIPNALDKAENSNAEEPKNLEIWLETIRPQGFVFSGGQNIGENPVRDQTERLLLSYAFSKNLPVLGICRGMQMIALHAGIGLHHVKNHVAKRHQIHGIINGTVNSFHEFAIDACPPDFEVIARGEDDEIEAIAATGMRCEAWMWHPEREQKFSQRDINRAASLFG